MKVKHSYYHEEYGKRFDGKKQLIDIIVVHNLVYGVVTSDGYFIQVPMDELEPVEDMAQERKA